MSRDIAKQRECQRKWMAARRAKYVAIHGGRCSKCGSTLKLEFDHIDRITKITHNIWSWSENRIVEELKKCQLLCKKCHQSKTYKELYKPREHGTDWMYRGGKCRCELCRKAHAKANAFYLDQAQERMKRTHENLSS